MAIQFGTDGWRDLIAQDFTEANLARVATAHGQMLRARGGHSVVVGFDTRFAGQRFATVAAHALAAQGLKVFLAGQYLPTPALSFAVKYLSASGGAMLTASHNPPDYQGYKLKGPYGGSATPALVKDVEAALAEPSTSPGASGDLQAFDLRLAYYAALNQLLDLETLRAYSGRLYYDSMGGAGSGWLEGYLQYAGLTQLDLKSLHPEPHPLFYGVNPEPIPQNLAELSEVLRGEDGLTFGVVTDGDADRVGAVTAGGTFFNSHQIFAVLTQHLWRRGWRGRVIKTVSGSGIIERLCAQLGLEVVETPVGFKYITDAFLEGLEDESRAVMIGGEESGGLAVRGHIPERDGLLSSLLLLEAVATSGKSLTTLFAEIEEKTDFKHCYDRADLHLAPDVDKVAALERAQHWTEVGGLSVQEVNLKDGVKLLLEGGGFVMLRASGTEPVVRVYAEAHSDASLRRLLTEATQRLTAQEA